MKSCETLHHQVAKMDTAVATTQPTKGSVIVTASRHINAREGKGKVGIAVASTPPPYVVLSPVLVPYVQAPIRYVKGSSNKISDSIQASSGAVRYVPAYAYTACQRVAAPANYVIYNNGNYVSPVKYRYSPFPSAYTSPHGSYHSALSPPMEYRSATVTEMATSNTKAAASEKSSSVLNPLSRPYTPPTKAKTPAAKATKISTEDIWSCDQRSSTPDVWFDDTLSDATSRTGSPLTCTLYHKDTDSDSGVEGDDDDVTSCCCICNKHRTAATSVASADDFLQSEFDDLRIPRRGSTDALSRDSTRLVSFVCKNLDTHEWRTVARELGVSDVIIQSVDYDVYENFREEMKFVFSYWARSHEADEPEASDSRRHLVEKALSEIGRKDLIFRLAAELTSESSDH